MFLENIKNFDWYNEPYNFRFIDEGLLIEAKPQTDFWQSRDYNFYKDNGHIFGENRQDNFILQAKWFFPKIKDSAQCGLIIRSDAYNWIKVGLLSPNPYCPQIGVVVSHQGYSDWSIVDFSKNINELYFRIKRRNNDFIVFYSQDGKSFHQIRMLHLPKISQTVFIGAYICSPKDERFEGILKEVDVQYL